MIVNLLKDSFIDKNLSLIIVVLIISVIIYIVVRVFYWVLFKKVKINPVLSIIPVLNYMKLIEIAELPKSTFFLLIIPVANIVAICRIKYEISIRFGKGLGFSVLYVLFPLLALYFLLPSSVVYTRLNYEEERFLGLTGETIEVDSFKDFKPEIKPGAVPFEENAKPYYENNIDLNVELKTIELGSENDESKKELVTANSNNNVIEQAPKVEVDLNSNSISNESATGVILNTSEKNGEQKIKCPKCGVMLDATDDYCFMCGNDL